MHKDQDYHYKNQIYNDGYESIEHEDYGYGELCYEEDNPEDLAYEDYGPKRLSHNKQGIEYSMYEGSSQVIEHNNSGGHEQMEYKGLVENSIYRDRDCDYKNSWLGSCLLFGFAEESASHEDPQAPKKAGGLWDYWSPKDNSSNKHPECKEPGQDCDNNYNNY